MTSRQSHRMFRLPMTLSLVAMIAACGANREPILFDGQSYRAKLSREDKSRQTFTVSVSPVSASFEGALEAGRYEATRHCIEFFGTSDIDWVVGPDDDPESLPIVQDSLNFSGSCRF